MGTEISYHPSQVGHEADEYEAKRAGEMGGRSDGVLLKEIMFRSLSKITKFLCLLQKNSLIKNTLLSGRRFF